MRSGPAHAPALTILTRPGCHLCDVMKDVVAEVRTRRPVDLVEVDIASRPDLERRFGAEIPVLLYGERVLARTRTSADRLLAQLTPRRQPAGR